MSVRGTHPELGTQLFDTIEHFAGYGFNKSHAAGYALVAYQTAWLKAHYPAEYMAALLTSSKSNKDRTALYLNECRSMGVEVLVPDVNSSESDFIARDGRIPFGLSAIRNVGEGVVALITEERNKNGEYASFQDFLDRVDMSALNKRTVESLIKAGCLRLDGCPPQGPHGGLRADARRRRVTSPGRGHGPVLVVRRRRAVRAVRAPSRSRISSGISAPGSPSRRRCSGCTCPTTRSSRSRR